MIKYCTSILRSFLQTKIDFSLGRAEDKYC
jgi:hypothetical protein